MAEGSAKLAPLLQFLTLSWREGRQLSVEIAFSPARGEMVPGREGRQLCVETAFSPRRPQAISGARGRWRPNPPATSLSAALCYPAPKPEGAPAMPDPGFAGFDFLIGNWTVDNEFLKHRLAGSTEWERFSS